MSDEEIRDNGEITDKINGDRFVGELVHLPLGVVVPSEKNPRQNMDKEPFAELKRSICENGLLQPIVVRAAGARYEIIGGHRRFAAVSELAQEAPNDARFARIAAMVVDVDDGALGILQLAENVNRADLAPLEVAAGVAAAIASGAAPDDVARGLGWNRRQLNRYLQLHEAPSWLKDFSREVKAAKTRRNERGVVVVDEVTQRPVVDVVTHAGLAFSHVFELVTAYNVLRQVDAERLAEGGDGFKPQAERVVRKLAAGAAADGWGVAKLRAEIKRAQQPANRGDGDAHTHPTSALVVARDRAVLDLARVRRVVGVERETLASELTALLVDVGFRVVVVKA